MIVKVAGPFGVDGPPPPHPARANKKTIAVTIPSRVRSRRVINRQNNKNRASGNGTICRQDAGGKRRCGGGATIAFVVMVTVEFTGPPLGVTVVPLHAASAGAPVQVNMTGELNPPTGVTVTGKVSVEPSVTFCVVVGPVSVKSGGVFVPLPVRLIFCGLLLSPSVRTRLAVSAAATDGLKVKLTVHVFEVPAGMLAPHVLAETA